MEKNIINMLIFELLCVHRRDYIFLDIIIHPTVPIWYVSDTWSCPIYI